MVSINVLPLSTGEARQRMWNGRGTSPWNIREPGVQGIYPLAAGGQKIAT